MKSSLAKKVMRLGERLKARFVSGTIILAYHRVAELASDPQRLAVTPHQFEEHLEILRREYNPMSLGDFVDAIRRGRVPDRTVVVTMDDGYADNLDQAKPLLERYDISATVFVAAGYVGSRREFWWDELERVFLQPGHLLDMLSLQLDGVEHKYVLGLAASYGPKELEAHATWNVESGRYPSARHAVYRSLVDSLRRLSENRRRNLLDQILCWARAEVDARTTHRTLRAEELLRLVDGGLINVGAHSVTHSVLAALSSAEQQVEIVESKLKLEEILGFKVDHFAYPFGSQNDYTQETVSLVRQAGFLSACANYAGVVWNARNRYEWPRVLVRDWNGDEFARRLQRWCSD